MGNNSEREAKDPETIEISAVFRNPARPVEDAAFQGFLIKRTSLSVIGDFAAIL